MFYVISAIISTIIMLGILFLKKDLLIERLIEELCFKYNNDCTEERFKRELRYNADTLLIVFFLLCFFPIINVIVLLIWLYKNHILDAFVDKIMKLK